MGFFLPYQVDRQDYFVNPKLDIFIKVKTITG